MSKTVLFATLSAVLLAGATYAAPGASAESEEQRVRDLSDVPVELSELLSPPN